MYNSRWKITKNQGFSILVALLPLAAEERVRRGYFVLRQKGAALQLLLYYSLSQKLKSPE
jgi:hypothetical protein